MSMNKSKDLTYSYVLDSCSRSIYDDASTFINLYNIDIEPMGTIEYIVTFPDYL